MTSKLITIEDFQTNEPSVATQLRSIVLFGNNVASYKFALAKSLLELSQQKETLITLDDLAIPYASKICEHLKHSPKQATSSSSRFLDVCTRFNSGELTLDQLQKITVQLGFNDIFDAFHIVNRGEIGTTFFEANKRQKHIILTDNLFKLAEDPTFKALERETESQ